MFLTAIGIVTPQKLGEIRKYGYLVMAILSALITPPDFISQIIVMAPLIALYELGVALSKVVYKRKLRAEEDGAVDRKSTRLNSSHVAISYAVFCLKKK